MDCNRISNRKAAPYRGVGMHVVTDGVIVGAGAGCSSEERDPLPLSLQRPLPYLVKAPNTFETSRTSTIEREKKRTPQFFPQSHATYVAWD